jgi:hypothetical protein
MRPGLKNKTKDRMLISFGDNLTAGGIPTKGKIWPEIMARVLTSFNYPPQGREEILGGCLDAIGYLLKKATP